MEKFSQPADKKSSKLNMVFYLVAQTSGEALDARVLPRRGTV